MFSKYHQRENTILEESKMHIHIVLLITIVLQILTLCGPLKISLLIGVLHLNIPMINSQTTTSTEPYVSVSKDEENVTINDYDNFKKCRNFSKCELHDFSSK